VENTVPLGSELIITTGKVGILKAHRLSKFPQNEGRHGRKM